MADLRMDVMRRLIGGTLAALTIVIFTPAAAHAVEEWREVGSSLFNTLNEKSAEARCPEGTMVVGSGGYIDGGNGNVVLTGVVPNINLDTVTVYAKGLPFNLSPWAVVALAICDDRGSGVQRKMGISFFGSARAECDPGQVLWSTGFNVPWATTTTYVSAVVPAADMSSVTVKGVATPTSAVIAYAICGHTSFSGGTELSSATTRIAPQGQTMLSVAPAFNGGRIFGVGISANRSGLFVDGLGMGWVPGESWATGRMSWLPGAGGLKTAARAGSASGDHEMTVWGDAIGSWYD
jgi:hypothetical protein